jgi:excisionase family DNA binding protein
MMSVDSLSAFVREIVRAVANEVIPLAIERAIPKVVAEVRRVMDGDSSMGALVMYVRVQSAAEMMSAHPSTVRKLVAAGKLGRYTVEGHLRIKVSEVQAYLAREGSAISTTIDIHERALAILSHSKPRNETG